MTNLSALVFVAGRRFSPHDNEVWTTGPRTASVLLADNHPMVLHGVRDLLAAASDIEIVAEARDGLQA